MVAIAPGMFLAHSVVPSSGSTAISTLGPFLLPTFSPMNSIGASSQLALADHHRAVDRQLVELAPHGVDRGLVGRLLVAVAAQPRRRHRRALGHAHDLEREDALEHQMRLDGDRRRHVGPTLPSRRPAPSAADLSYSADSISFFRCGSIAASPEITLSRFDRRQRSAHRILGGRIGDQDHRNRAAALWHRRRPAGGRRGGAARSIPARFAARRGACAMVAAVPGLSTASRRM